MVQIPSMAQELCAAGMAKKKKKKKKKGKVMALIASEGEKGKREKFDWLCPAQS